MNNHGRVGLGAVVAIALAVAVIAGLTTWAIVGTMHDDEPIETRGTAAPTAEQLPYPTPPTTRQSAEDVEPDSGLEESPVTPDTTAVRDASLQVNLSGIVRRSPLLASHDIAVSVRDGVVVLTGEVADETLKRRAEEMIRNVDGVENVVNEIEVRAT